MKRILIILLIIGGHASLMAAPKKPLVIAYYNGNGQTAANYELNKVTHIIYSFLHLYGDTLGFSSSGRQQTALRQLVALKQTYPQLKVLVSLGGWGGCAPCSPTFAKAESRKNFALSVKKICDEYNVDGIDLDWEYPAIKGYPGHAYIPEDKPNFTALVKELREALGKKRIVSFAAGGKSEHIEQSIDWKGVMPYVDFANLMTYDLVGGYATTTGHHTPLFSTRQQKESSDNCIQWLLNNGVDAHKLIIGAAFYGRVFENVGPDNNGRYQAGKFRQGVSFNAMDKYLSPDSGFVQYWDDTAHAPYAYNASRKLFVTYDNKRSVAEKVAYMKKYKLGGIMFWVLPEDTYRDGLLDAIDKAVHSK